MAKPEKQQRVLVRLQFQHTPYPQGPLYAAPYDFCDEPLSGRSMLLEFQGVPDARGIVEAIASVTGPDRPRGLLIRGKAFRLMANDTHVIARGIVRKQVVVTYEGTEIVDALARQEGIKQRKPPKLPSKLRGSKQPPPNSLPNINGPHPHRYDQIKVDPDSPPNYKWTPWNK